MSYLILQANVLGEPKAQARHRHFKIGDHTSTFDPSSKAKDMLAVILQEKAPNIPPDVSIAIELTFYMSRPKSHFGTGKNASILKTTAPEWHKSKPDLDNLIKFVTDAMNKIFYKDDSQIGQFVARKLYSERPRTEILITTLI